MKDTLGRQGSVLILYDPYNMNHTEYVIQLTGQ